MSLDFGSAELAAWRRWFREIIPDREIVSHYGRQFLDYFSGRSRGFDFPLDLSKRTPFEKSVARATLKVPYGKTATYAEVARQAGHPGAARAVGGALGRNALAIVVPCHRVVAARGLGGYSPGLELKLQLLRLEGAPMAARKGMG